MKKTFHLGIASLLLIAASSCSKSVNELPAPESSMQENKIAGNMATGKFAGGMQSPVALPDGPFAVYNYTNQPYPLQLGNGKESVITSNSGKFAVFYVILADQYASVPVKQVTFSLLSEENFETVANGEAMESGEAPKYNLKVPEELNGHPFYFIMVPITSFDDYVDHTFTITSEVMFESSLLTAELPSAFVYKK